MQPKWKPFDEGRSIRTQGSEDGVILKDEEHNSSARITLETDSKVAPYSITLGIYGLMFHTEFYDSIENAEIDYLSLKGKIERVVSHLTLTGQARDAEWNDTLDRLVEDIVQ